MDTYPQIEIHHPVLFDRYKASTAARSLRMNIMTSTIETKSGVTTLPDGVELGHNNLVGFSNTILRTINGTLDMADGSGNRIGDKILLISMQVKGMLELNERYSDVSVKVLVIKAAKGDVPTNSNLWQGASTNKLLDSFNSERFTILKSKFIKLRAPNMPIVAAAVDNPLP